MRKPLLPLTATLPLLLAACQSGPTHMFPQPLSPGHVTFTQIAQSDHQWTGVAVSHKGRIFVNFPRWSDDVPTSVAELKPEHWGTSKLIPIPFPDWNWQQYHEGKDPATHLVCVQSVVVDDQDNLWIVDAGAPNMDEVIPNAPKLLKVDLQTNNVVAKFPFAAPVITDHSYLNDVRVDTKKQVAYLTDSGAGAIIVLDLATGHARRLLADDPSTQSEHAAIVIDGKTWTRNGRQPSVNADGIALSPDGQFLYYHALTGETLYRINTQFLLDPSLSPEELARHVERLARIGPCDGMLFDRDTSLFYTNLEHNAVSRWFRHPGHSMSQSETLASSPNLQWPDSLAIGPDGALYVTASQINLQPNPHSPYRLFKLTRKELSH